MQGDGVHRINADGAGHIRSKTAWYAGGWDDAGCAAHHQDSLARYFHLTVPEQKSVTIELSAGALHVSQGTPTSDWDAAPNGTYEQRR